MKTIELRNKQLTSILNTYIDGFLAIDRSTFPYSKREVIPEYACGEEYLLHMQSKKVTGFPEKTYGVDLHQYVPPPLAKPLQRLDTELMSWSGSRSNAVKMVYPQGGYMGWHHNANAPGFNILLSWSERGLGYFRYQDPITKEIVTIDDKPGWTCKVGYYGSFTEPDKMYWHCASAEHEERVTLGYIIPHEGMWANMCEDIETV